MSVNLINTRPASRQQGAILTVALILLFLLSILGLAVMKTSTLEEKMAANALHEDIAFQATETISENTISDIQNMNNAFNATNQTVSDTSNNVGATGISATWSLTYTGTSLAPGGSAGIGGSNPVAHRFVVDTTGTIDEANTSSRIIQGFYRIAPSAEGN